MKKRIKKYIDLYLLCLNNVELDAWCGGIQLIDGKYYISIYFGPEHYTTVEDTLELYKGHLKKIKYIYNNNLLILVKTQSKWCFNPKHAWMDAGTTWYHLYKMGY